MTATVMSPTLMTATKMTGHAPKPLHYIMGNMEVVDRLENV